MNKKFYLLFLGHKIGMRERKMVNGKIQSFMENLKKAITRINDFCVSLINYFCLKILLAAPVFFTHEFGIDPTPFNAA